MDQQGRQTFSQIVEKVAPAIVSIYTRVIVEGHSPSDLFGPFGYQAPRRVERSALGSGVFISSNGLIVTNNHVVQAAERIKVVTADETQFDAERVLNDPVHDLAVIRLVEATEDDEDDVPDRDDIPNFSRSRNRSPRRAREKPDVRLEDIEFPFLKVGRCEMSQVGDLVLAFGNNLGFRGTVTDGIISAIGRTSDERLPIAHPQFPLIQTNASINPGSSGGALVNINGDLIGINESIATPSGGNVGVGFAVPSNFIAPLLRAAVARLYEIERVWDGITATSVKTLLSKQEKSDDKNRPTGVRVKDVFHESPGAECGITKDDIVLRINDVEISSLDVYYLTIVALPPKEKATYVLQRGSEIIHVDVDVDIIPPPEQEPTEITDKLNPLDGTVITQLCPSLNLDYGFELTLEGVIVVDVYPQSQAAGLGFRVGDILVSYEDRSIRTVKDVEAISKHLKKARGVRIKFKRNGRTRHIDVYMRSPHRYRIGVSRL